jgi:hypothetical protein
MGTKPLENANDNCHENFFEYLGVELVMLKWTRGDLNPHHSGDAPANPSFFFFNSY